MGSAAKTLLLHWVRIPKTVKPDMLLRYHLTCVKYDSYRLDDIYYYANTIPHDSSTTCTDMNHGHEAHFQDHIQDTSKPYKFEFTRDDAAASRNLVVRHTAFRGRADLEERAN
eukprot:jgi/Tetstr1/444587/TSEL_032437.t1